MSDTQRSTPVQDHGAPSGRDVEAHLLGIPDALPPTWCKKCSVEVQPEGKGKCLRCGAFLKLNFVTRKHPVNVVRRDQLLAQLVAEHRPQSLVARTTCLHLAATWERLEAIKAGSPEWQRLTVVSQTLSQSLRDACVDAAASNAAARDMSHLGVAELAERAAFVAERLLDMTLAVQEGRKQIAAAGEEHRTARQDAEVERHIKAVETGHPVPDWFRTWLEEQP